MTIPPLHGGASGVPALRVPVLTAPVSTGVPPLVGDDATGFAPGAAGPRASDAPTRRDDAPISLAGRLESGDQLPETTQLALALESATRSMQQGRADQVLSALDAIWSDQLDADSPWYLRAAALQLLGRTGDAEQVLRNAIVRLPRSAAMLYLLGVHTAERGSLEAAQLASGHALALHPTEPLLRLQGAALVARDTHADAIAALLDQIRAQQPGFPAEIWLATLIRLHDDAERRAAAHTPRVSIDRLTPVSLRAIDGSLMLPVSPEPASGTLELALRYGLSLLESPTQSARMATRSDIVAQSVSDAGSLHAASAAIPPVRAALPMWETLVLVSAVVVIVQLPQMRIPALLLAGVAALALLSRRLR